MRQRTKDFIKTWRAFLTWLAVMIVMTLALLLSGGCARTVYVPQERVVSRTDTVTRYLTVTDTAMSVVRVYESDTRYDSIAPILDSLNRVTGWDRYHFRERTKMDEREKSRMQAVIDSLRNVRADTVTERIPCPVERKLTRWEQTKQDVGGMAIGGLCAVTLAAIIIWIIKRKRKL